ncbi:MAG: efflux RND transporter permease subunit, partial [Bacteroidota bacterium]
RPIAILMSLLALIIFSGLALWQLPVSLLPETEVPKLSIAINYPNATPVQIEVNALAPVREALATLNGLAQMESTAFYGSGQLNLSFKYGLDMDLVYIEANEKIDRLTTQLPENIERPLVIKSNAADIPIMAIQVVPGQNTSLLEISELTQYVLKKRIEQLEGVSLVDLNGLQKQIISLSFFEDKINALGLSSDQIIRAISENNRQLGSISVKDGQYRYTIKVTNPLSDQRSLSNLPIKLDQGSIIRMSNLASIEYRLKKNQGAHVFNGEDALVIAVHKQASARMNDLTQKVRALVEQFKDDYPQASFYVTRDQSGLLTLSIDNLLTSLAFGGVFAFLVLLVFMGNLKMPLIMGISLPTSLLLSFLLLFAFDLSINIISISGLALGLGMLIDNAIIVLDNINQKRKQGLSLFDSCCQGATEVMPALISSMLTTLAVFVPLIFLGGIPGTLFYDQAIAIGAILTVSLLVAYILIPLLYKILVPDRSLLSENSTAYSYVKKAYKTAYYWVTHRRKIVLFLFASIAGSGVYIAQKLEIDGLPVTNNREKLVSIDWNEPIDAQENKRRINEWLTNLDQTYFVATESDVGVTQYILNPEKGDTRKAKVYLTLGTDLNIYNITRPLLSRFPFAKVTMTDAPNAFDQLFSNPDPYWLAKIRISKKNSDSTRDLLTGLNNVENLSSLVRGVEFEQETALNLVVDNEKLAIYDIDRNTVYDQLSLLFSDYLITEIKSYGSITPVVLQAPRNEVQEKMRTSYITNKDGASYALSNLVMVDYTTSSKSVRADWSGRYFSMETESVDDIKALENEFLNFGIANNVLVDFGGMYYKNLEDIRRLALIFTISVLLLYFILVAQFESFTQPLVVIFTLPFGFAGSILLLFLTGTSINIMSGIGIIIMLGIIVNDSILKIDTINRLRKQGMETSEAIFKAGSMRLKPILMTSITTILAVLPLVFASGLGAELQKPLVYAVIGGLIFGTLASLFFIPLAYSMLSGKTALNSQRRTSTTP